MIRNSERNTSSRSRITLVDFSPLLKENFKRLAFDWEELNCDVVEFETPEFRYLEQSIQQQHRDNEEEDGNANQFAEIQPNFDNYKYGFPIDFQDQSLSDMLPDLKEFFNTN